MHRHVYVLLSFIWYSSVISLTFITENSLDDGRWTFQEGSTAILLCTNRPYTGIINFRFDSIWVLFCTGSVCMSNSKYQNTFSFIHDTDSGLFTWIINNVNMTYNNKEFECDDGSINIRNTVTVNMEKGDSSEKHLNEVMKVIFTAGVLGGVVILVICSILCILIRRRRKRKDYRTHKDIASQRDKDLRNAILSFADK